MDAANEKLFVCGELMSSEVQERIIGRRIIGIPDTLVEYRMIEIRIGGDVHPIIMILDLNHATDGCVLTLSMEELKRIDNHATMYRRKEVVLNSGAKTWIYDADMTRMVKMGNC